MDCHKLSCMYFRENEREVSPNPLSSQVFKATDTVAETNEIMTNHDADSIKRRSPGD